MNRIWLLCIDLYTWRGGDDPEPSTRGAVRVNESFHSQGNTDCSIFIIERLIAMVMLEVRRVIYSHDSQSGCFCTSAKIVFFLK